MEFSNDEKFDNILLDIIQHVNTLPNFLDVMFGFLKRRTDLYYTLDNQNQNMGFLPGKAEELIYNAYNKHKQLFNQIKHKPNDPVPSPIRALPPAINNRKPTEKPVELSSKESDSSYVADADCYNGASCDNYSWSQTIGELDIRVNMPTSVVSSKQVTVRMDRSNVEVLCDNDESVLCGQLSWEVRHTELIWSLDRAASQLLLSVEKSQERWWEACFVGEPTINTRAIDCSRPVSDLDDEAQAKIQKLMYDNQQKQLGLPTSDQQKMNDILQKAWNVEGSPFAGTEFDPSQIDVVGNNS